MNPSPPFQLRGRGFGYGGSFSVHEHMANSPLAWATFALVLLLVLTVGVLLVARFSRGGRRHGRHFGPPMMRMRGGGGRPDPLEILRMRFASGQMTRDEFLQATSDLTATATTVEQPPPPAS